MDKPVDNSSQGADFKVFLGEADSVCGQIFMGGRCKTLRPKSHIFWMQIVKLSLSVLNPT